MSGRNQRRNRSFGFNNNPPVNVPNRRSYGGPSNYQDNYGFGDNNFGRNEDFSRNDDYGAGSRSDLTAEQVAFESEFSKWEKSFQDWQDIYANHPDKSAYKQYEKKFLDVRDKLLEKRTQIFTKSLKPTLELQLSAAESMADDILSKFGGPSGSNQFGNFNSGMDPRGNFNSGMDPRGNYNPMSPYDRFSNSYFDQSFGSGPMDFQGSPNLSGPGPSRGRRSGNNFQNRRSGDGGNFSANNFNTPNRKGPGRQNAYPNSPWTRTNQGVQPPLVGKRRKQKNAKIVKVLENKAKLASGTTTEAINNSNKKKQPQQQQQQQQQNRSTENPVQKYEALLAAAMEAELPLRMSGAGRRNYIKLKAKPPTEWNEIDKKFMDYATYLHKKRDDYFDNLRKKREEEEKKTKEAMETSKTGENPQTSQEKPDEIQTSVVDLTSEPTEAQESKETWMEVGSSEEKNSIPM